jgi:hypothetical protein
MTALQDSPSPVLTLTVIQRDLADALRRSPPGSRP